MVDRRTKVNEKSTYLIPPSSDPVWFAIWDSRKMMNVQNEKAESIETSREERGGKERERNEGIEENGTGGAGSEGA